MASLEQWIKDFPVITRTYMAGALLTTAACALDLLSPFSLYFSFPMIIYKHQYWRLLTNFFFFGASFSLDFLFHMFFLVRYCRALEEGSFRGRTADFAWMILLGATSMTLIAPFVNLHFLGSSLTFMMVYIWARRNPFARMNFLGLFTFTAPYLPYVLLSFSVMLGNNGAVDILGIVVGHLYYFLEDVYPLMIVSHRRLLKTPRIVELLFAGEIQVAQPVQPPGGGGVGAGVVDGAAVGGAANVGGGVGEEDHPAVVGEGALADQIAAQQAQAVADREAAAERQDGERLIGAH